VIIDPRARVGGHEFREDHGIRALSGREENDGEGNEEEQQEQEQTQAKCREPGIETGGCFADHRSMVP
jgi:hypothetical protein